MSHKILIVDDEADLELLVRQKFRNRIKEGDLVFEFVENGQKALDRLGTEPDIELVLSDINMPQMDGLTLLDRIRENNFTQKTIMISAYGDMNNIRVAMNRGAFDFVVKPIDFGDFEITVNKAIEAAKRQREANEIKQHLEDERKEKEELILNQNKVLEQRVEERTEQLKTEKQKSDDLLLNILPHEVAEELKHKGTAEAKLFEQVSVLFTDFVDFTRVSERLSPTELVRDLHECFTAFDNIMHKYGLEKIKTIGDAYMAAGGLPTPSNTHAADIVNAALEIRKFIEEGKVKRLANDEPFFEIRIGIHTGPVVAGIVGVKKFAYDIWGDTVNTASRMESSGEVGKVNISGSTFDLVKDRFICTHRGKVTAKGKGEIDMYFVESPNI